MKKKPHQQQSAIKKVFSDFRSRLHEPDKQANGIQYEIRKKKEGYQLIIHKERAADQHLHFDTKAQLDEYLAALS